MPGLTIATDGRPASTSTRGTTANPRRGASTTSPTTRPSSPPRPPVSPITPTLGPTQLTGGPTAPTTSTTTTSKSNHNNANNDAIPNFALGRPVLTHATQTDQVAAAPPPAQPIDFDNNPDVLALKSAISILQLQRARATADIQSLNRVKQAALADPGAFVADLAAGGVRVEGDPLFSNPGDDDDEDDDDDSEEEEDDETQAYQGQQGQTPDNDTPMTDDTATKKPNRKGKQRAGATTTNTTPAWRKLPKPQTVVRCPPINWAQYGVVGESLDKLHAEQLAAPNPGAPAVLGAGGTYEFKAGEQPTTAAGAGGGEGRRLVGIAAPYTPGKDRLEKKGKGGRR